MPRPWPTKSRLQQVLIRVQLFWATSSAAVHQPCVTVNASLMGYHAVDLLDKGIYNRVVALSGGKIVDYDVNVALSMHKYLDPMEIEVAQAISI